MATVNGIFKPSGTLEGVTFYNRYDSDKVIMRKKGGPRKERMATGKEFAKVRKHQAEWGACVLFGRAMKFAVGELYAMNDHNLSAAWTGVGKKLMGIDKVNELGKRELRLSNYKEAMLNYQFCRKKPLASVLHVQPTYSMDREQLSAEVRFEGITTANELVNAGRWPYFRLVVALGCVSDISLKNSFFDKYAPDNDELYGVSTIGSTAWLSANDVLGVQVIAVKFADFYRTQLGDEVTVVLSVGVEFGSVGFGGVIEGVRKSGAAKILALV